MTRTRVLVTGAAGFIAAHLVHALRRAGPAHVVGADRRAAPADLPLDEAHTLDLLAPDALPALVVSAAPDEVYHLVGAVRGPEEVVRATNVETTRRLLQALRAAAPRARVVLVGSAAEYGVVPLAAQPVAEDHAGEPAGAYGRAKAEVTALARAAAAGHGQRVAVARPFNVVGAGVPDSLVAGAIVARVRDALGAPPPRAIRMGRTTAIRDFVAVDDVAEGLLQVARAGRPGQAYNLCTGEGHSVAELLELVLHLAGEPIAVERDESLLRADDVDALVGSGERARRELGWRPRVPFEAAVRAAWEAR